MAEAWQEILDNWSSGKPVTTTTSTGSGSSKDSQAILDDFSGSSQKEKYDAAIAPVAASAIEQAKKKKEEEAKKEEEEEKEKERSWFEAGLFEDGYQFGDIVKSILGTGADVVENVGTGVVGMGEKILDAGAYIAPYVAQGEFYKNGGAYNLELQKKQDEAFKQSKKDMGDFIAKDLYDEEKIVKGIVTGATGVDVDDYSVLGEKTDALAQSGGQLLATAGLAAVGVPWFLTTGATSFGSEAENAFREGATYEQAGASAAVSAAAEILYEKLSGGISFGGKTLDDALTKQIASGISSKMGRTFAKLGMDMAGEGAEEIFSQVASNLGSALYKDDSVKDLLLSEEAFDEYLESFIGGAIMGGVSGSYNAVKSAKNGVDYATELTVNEQKVVDKLFKDELAAREKQGKVTQKEKTEIYDSILKDMENGYISTDTIEEVLGGEAYTTYRDTVDSEDAILKEYDELGQKTNATLKEQTRYSELTQKVKDINEKSQRNSLKAKLSEDVMGLVKGDRLAESYNQRYQSGQKYEADITQYDTKQQAVVQKAIDSGILNNSRRTHEFVDFVSKISADTGVLFDFSNTAKIREAGFALEGQTVDGFITKDGITVNVDSPKSRQFVVGHEITHALEGSELYDALRQSVFDYAKMKNQYGVRMESIQKRYKEGTDFEAELTADLVGEYIFSDTDFINNLSTQNRNVFQKVFDEIKYLCKVATAGSKEARELERVKRAFEKAYREGGKTQTDTKYSVSDKNIKDTSTGYSHGESYYTMTYTQDGKVVGTLQYGEYEGEANVKMIEVEPKYRRKGIATKLMQELQNKYPDTQIEFGMSTPDGTKLLESITYDVTDDAVVADRQKLKNLQTELNDLQEKLDALYDTDNLTEEQDAELEKLGDRWQEVYESIHELSEGLRGKKATRTFVKTDTKHSLSKNGAQHTPDSLSALRLAPAPMKTELSDYAVGLIRFATDGNLTWGKVRQIIDRPEYREAFEEVTGITLKGSRSEQKRQVMNEAEELYRHKNMVQDIVQKSTPVWTADNLRPVLPDEHLTIYTDERFQPLLEAMTDGKMTFAGAKTIANSSSLRSAFESLYGIELPKTNSKAVPHIISLAEDVNSLEDAYNATQMSAETGINSITDEDVPSLEESYAPIPNSDPRYVQTAPTYDLPGGQQTYVPTKATYDATPTDDIAPLFDATGKKGVPDGQQAFMPDSGKDVKQTRKEYHQSIVDNIKASFKARGFDFDEVLKKAKNLSTWATVDNTPQRVMEKSLGYKEGGILADITVNKVAQNESEGIKWLNDHVKQLKQISKEYHIKPGSKESAAAQMFAEGFYVNEKNEIVRYGEPELIQDFKDPNVRERIKRLARDPRIRNIYDTALSEINESRVRNLYPEIPKLDNYFLHFRAMADTFSTLGLPFNPNDIRAKDLPTDLNGVTADLKPGQPYFASANHRTGKRTSFDLLGGVERYLNSAKNQIYHIDDIQTLRALRNYIAETYGQASGLEDIDSMSDVEAEERIKQVYGSHLSTFAKFLNEEANVLAGKTALVDRGIEGIIGRRGITFLNTLNGQVGSNMVGYNISSSLTNFLPVAQTFAKSNKFDFTKAFAQTVANKFSGGKFDSFAEDSPVVIRRKGEDRFHQTFWQKMQNPGYALMGAVDDISTEIIARTKYNELTRKGMDSQKAHFETDKWVSRLMGDRSLGQQPQLYNSKMLGLVTKFQLEVRNQLDAQFYDTIQETKASNEQIQNGLRRNAKTAAQVASTFTQLAVVQHLFGKAFESVAGYNPAFDIIEVLMTAFGFDDEEDSEDTALDNLGQGLMALAEDMPYASVFLDGGRVPVSEAIPNIGAALKGEDEYGNDIGVGKALWEEAKDIAPYYLMPAGYGQVKKTKAGMEMFSDDHPIAGSYTAAGNLRFPVEDTPLSRVKAGIFGQYASENARKYFDEEQTTLNADQTKVFAEMDIPIEDYWDYRDNLNDFYDVKDKAKEAANAEGATEEDILKNKYFNAVNSDIYNLYEKQKEIASGDSEDKQEQLRDIQKQMEELLYKSETGADSVTVSGIYAEVGDRRFNYDEKKDTWYEIKPKTSDGEDNWYYIQEKLSHENLGISYEDFWNGNTTPAEDATYYAEYNGKRYNYDADKSQWYEIREKNDDGSDNWYYQMEQTVTKSLGLSYEEYWSKPKEYNYAYENPGRYAIAQTVGGYDTYMVYKDALENWQSDSYIGADKDANGNSISGSRKKKVIEYIDGLDLDDGEKLILYRTQYSSKKDKRAYNDDIVDYLNDRDDISYSQMKSILEELGMTVDDNGNIDW